MAQRAGSLLVTLGVLSQRERDRLEPELGDRLEAEAARFLRRYGPEFFESSRAESRSALEFLYGVQLDGDEDA